MNSLTWKILSLLVMLELVSVCRSAHQDHLRSLAAASNDFATRLYNALRRTNKENFFFSPLSLCIALGMLYHGSGGNTARELNHVLGYQRAGLQGPDSVSYAVGLYMQRTWSREFELNLANLVVVDRKVNLNEQYRNAMNRIYQSPVEKADFERNSAMITTKINSWVYRKTKGMIPTLLDRLDPSNLMVILNAAYFRGLWEKPFDPRATAPQTFYNFGRRPTMVKMMKIRDKILPYFNGGSFCAVNLPYRGNMSMLILLPELRTGLPALQDALSASFLASTLSNLHPTNLNVHFPKFQALSANNLKNTLQSMGMRSAFGPQANFSGISRTGGVRVNEVVHKASIIVDERGTVAAAATGITFVKLSMPPRAVEFVVDRPFVYVIIDRRNDFVLFMGRVCRL